jgi:hypothetical protein
MKNDLSHLNDALHDLLDQLTDPTDADGASLDPEALRLRIQRAGAIGHLAGHIIDVGRLALDAERLRADHPSLEVPRLITGRTGREDR